MMTEISKETDSLGQVDVPAEKLWGAQIQRLLEFFQQLEQVLKNRRESKTHR